MRKIIAYLRVSTDKQGIRGLGIDAQREAVSSWAAKNDAEVDREFVEVQSGRKAIRKELSGALALADCSGMTLVVAKLDRLSRDVDMIRRICNSSVAVVFCDFPQIPEGPIGKFMLTMLAAVAEFEAGLISQRTKDALVAAKARGVKLGCPNGAAALDRYRARLQAQQQGFDNTAGTAAAVVARARRRSTQVSAAT